jgi:hypothetical protein
MKQDDDKALIEAVAQLVAQAAIRKLAAGTRGEGGKETGNETPRRGKRTGNETRESCERKQGSKRR